jgi:hypothetical protein
LIYSEAIEEQSQDMTFLDFINMDTLGTTFSDDEDIEESRGLKRPSSMMEAEDDTDCE